MPGKRKPRGDEGAAGKRQKTAHSHDVPTSEEVHTTRQLRQLLTFEQDLRHARHGLQSFKNVLDCIINGQEGSSEMLQIVTEYLDVIKPDEEREEVPVYLPDIMETWSMGSQMGNENVMSAVAVVLALLLKIISGNDSLVAHGLGICRTLVHKRQQDLLAKNLSADKGKDFIISPTLRLLREAISLDGGTLAAPIFRARNSTYKSLARNMGLRYLGDGTEDPKRPSVRTNAIRFFLSSLRFLHMEAKRDLLFQREIVAALMRHLRDDPSSLIYEILDTLKKCVVLDRKLPRDVKIRLLNAQSLTRISSLYGYPHENPETDEDRPTVEDAAHTFLLAACTDPGAGVCRTQRGFYPDGVDPEDLSQSGSGHSLDFGLGSISWMGKFKDDIPVRNMLLAEFILSLRPWANPKQAILLISIFETAPELIAYYLSYKKSFSFDPKLSATWIGYAALLYETVQLHIPKFFGNTGGYARIPPPTAVVLGNILPAPITLKVLVRCLTNKSKLVAFYAVRILIMSLQKLSRALEMFQEASSSPDSLWSEASRQLLDEFYPRIPDIQDVINYYRGVVEEDLLQREATSRLLRLYYEVIPQTALKAKFDVSPKLHASIERVSRPSEVGEDAAMALMELSHVCAITKYSPGMRWFVQASASASSSPFISLLKLYIDRSAELSQDNVFGVLNSVAEESQLVEASRQKPGLEPLVTALKGLEDIDSAIWNFLGNCAERCGRSPIKYIGMIEEELVKADIGWDNGATTCPLMMTMVEQIPYFVSSSSKSNMKAQLSFLASFLRHSLENGVSGEFLEVCKKLLVSAIGDSKAEKKLDFTKKSKKKSKVTAPDDMDQDEESNAEETTDLHQTSQVSLAVSKSDMNGESSVALSAQELEERLAVPIPASKDSAMLKWASKTAEELVEEGHASALIWLLASEHPSVRKEALVNITKMAGRIRDSAYEENEQVWLLLMELVESVKESAVNTDDSTASPIPNVTLAFATRALDVLKNPLHCLYEKVNVFLTRGPSWSLDKVPLVKSILQEGPTEDGSYYAELSWLLAFLLDGLRAPRDVALYRRRGVFERVLAVACLPYLGAGLRVQVLRLLYRATSIEGGSDALITRFGAASWLDAQRSAVSPPDPAERALYQALIRRLWDKCDQARIEAWSKGGIRKLAERR